MEKRDVAIVVAALAIVLFVGLIGKPLATGQPIDLGIPIPSLSPSKEAPGGTSSKPVGTSVFPASVNASPARATTQPATTTTRPTTPPTPWSGRVQTFSVTPSPTPFHGDNLSFTRFPENDTANRSLITYAIVKGRVSGSTAPVTIPFPYWELSYYVEPWNETYREDIGEARSQSVSEVVGSQIFPSFELDVVDAANPNDVVRTIKPPGGLDSYLWTGKKTETSTGGSASSGTTIGKTFNESQVVDPRPWVEKFYEGTDTRSYIFVIRSHMIQYYTLDVRVPAQYLGKF